MRRLILAVLALCLIPLAGWAQAPKDSWENLKQLRPGHKIKVVDMKFKSWSGKLVSISDEAVVVQDKRNQQSVTVERKNVLKVKDLERSKRGRNAAIGLVIGGVLGATRGTEGQAYAAVLAGVFGGIGAGIGALIPGHPTLYKSPPPQGNATARADTSSPAQ
jgi:hypothetical protein